MKQSSIPFDNTTSQTKTTCYILGEAVFQNILRKRLFTTLTKEEGGLLLKKLNLKLVVKSLIVSIFASSLVIGSMTGSANAERKFIRFGGSNPGGSWFTIVGGLSAYLSGQLDDLNVTAIATGGSVDNNRQARKKRLDTWLTHSLTAYDNWNGVGLFEDKGGYKDIRLLCGVYENHHHFWSWTIAVSKVCLISREKKLFWDRPAAAVQ